MLLRHKCNWLMQSIENVTASTERSYLTGEVLPLAAQRAENQVQDIANKIQDSLLYDHCIFVQPHLDPEESRFVFKTRGCYCT